MDNLRTAFQLADRVEEVESQLKEVQFEWGEIEEKLLAREERLRKRLSRELKRELDSPVGTIPGLTPRGDEIVAPAASQAVKKGIALRFRQLKQEG